MEGFVQLITVAVVFILVLVITFYTTRWIGNFQKSRNTASNIELLDAVRISQYQFIQIVKVGSQFLVVGVSRDNMVLLSKCDEEELHLGDTTLSDSSAGDGFDTSNAFKSLLEKAKKKLPHS